MARLLKSGTNEDPEALVRAVTVPVSVITGSDDAVSPVDWSVRLAQASGGDSHVHPGGHNACFVDPQAVDRALRRAVESCLRPHERAG